MLQCVVLHFVDEHETLNVEEEGESKKRGARGRSG